MNTPIRLDTLTSAKATGFDEPFEMMEACHERVHRMLDLLQRLRAHLRDSGNDEQSQQAARDVMRYFDKAAPQHHRDEELHVFPPLLARGEPATVEVVRRLQADHVQMESGWAAAREVLQAVAEGQRAALAPADEACLARFAALYDGHIEAEEKIVYPAASALLDQPAKAAMGREMAGRRGVG